MKYTPALLALTHLMTAATRCHADAPKLIARYPLTAETIADGKLLDVSDAQRHASAGGLVFDAAENAARIAAGAPAATFAGKWMDRVMGEFTFCAWLKADDIAGVKGFADGWLFRKGDNNGFQIALNDASGALMFHGYPGGKWYHNVSRPGTFPTGRWLHFAIAFRRGGDSHVYIDGRSVFRVATERATLPVADPWRFAGGKWRGSARNIALYAGALTEDEIRAEMSGANDSARAAIADDALPAPGYSVAFSLARFDAPKGHAPYDSVTRVPAQRRPAPDAVDWPAQRLCVPGQPPAPLFAKSGREIHEIPLSAPDVVIRKRDGRETEIRPANVWVRALPWRWGRYTLHSTDRAVRFGVADYELWAFPVRIAGDEKIESVALRQNNEEIYTRTETLDTLTLLLPHGDYEISVNGAAWQRLSVGLQDIVPGDPRDEQKRVELAIDTPRGRVSVRNAPPPDPHPNAAAWAADLAAMTNAPAFRRAKTEASHTFKARLAADVAASPVSIYLANQNFGMSGGAYIGSDHIPAFKGTPDEYAAHLADIGFDIDTAKIQTHHLPPDRDAYVDWIEALARHGIRAMVNDTADAVCHANYAFLAETQPDFARVARRDIQLLAQRFGGCANFAGIAAGGDNGGYVSFWHWAPPYNDRPWGRAFLAFCEANDMPPRIPTPAGLGKHTDWDAPGTQREFADYIRRYDATFANIAHLDAALADVDPRLVFSSGSFGSAPGVIARGGYPIGSVPSYEMHENMRLMTAYDWSETSASKPLHNAALIDRMRSDFPDKPVWSTIDDFGLFFGKAPRERAWAFVLTRGVQGIGTTFLAHKDVPQGPTGNLKFYPRPWQRVVEEQKELFAHIHKFGGAYAAMRPAARVGILHVHAAAVMRQCSAPGPEGPHEGKTMEALFLAHMADLPARIVGDAELKRGLPADMDILLLTGLPRGDGSWNWYDGLEDALAQFVARGGRILLDHESVVPTGVVAESSGMKLSAYVNQSNRDLSPEIVKRNLENAATLRALVPDSGKLAASAFPTFWTVPSRAGNTDYVTAMHWESLTGENASANIAPVVGTITWQGLGARPIYDITDGKKLTPEEAAQCDLTTRGACLYAIPQAAPARVEVLEIRTELPPKDVYQRIVPRVFAADGKELTGIPVTIGVKSVWSGELCKIAGVSGVETEIPVTHDEEAWVKVFDLLERNFSEVKLVSARLKGNILDDNKAAVDALQKFLTRKETPLVIALTPEQNASENWRCVAVSLAEEMRKHRADVRIDEIKLGGVIRGIHPVRASRFGGGTPRPQWQSVDADLVLFGNATNNVLIFDQAKGALTDSATRGPIVTYSPFEGHHNALNILCDSAEEARAIVEESVRRD